MRRLWVRWALLIVFVGLIGTVFVNLGDWQLDRLHQRRERNAAAIKAVPARITEALPTRSRKTARERRDMT